MCCCFFVVVHKKKRLNWAIHNRTKRVLLYSIFLFTVNRLRNLIFVRLQNTKAVDIVTLLANIWPNRVGLIFFHTEKKNKREKERERERKRESKSFLVNMFLQYNALCLHSKQTKMKMNESYAVDTIKFSMRVRWALSRAVSNMHIYGMVNLMLLWCGCFPHLDFCCFTYIRLQSTKWNGKYIFAFMWI